MKQSINYPGPSTLTGQGVEPPAALCWGALPLSQLPNRKAFRVGWEPWNYLWKQIAEVEPRGRCVSRPEPESSHPTTTGCFLNTFFSSLPGYVAAEAKVYKFLSLPPAHCSRFRGFDDRSLPPGILFEAIARLGTRPCLLFSVLDPGKNEALPAPSLERGLSSGFSLSGMGSCR